MSKDMLDLRVLYRSRLTSSDLFEDKIAAATRAVPHDAPREIGVYACGCGAVSLRPIELGHMIGYPNEYGLPHCPFPGSAARYIYKLGR